MNSFLPFLWNSLSFGVNVPLLDRDAVFSEETLATGGSRGGTRCVPQLKFLHFHAFLGVGGPNNRLGLAPNRLGNLDMRQLQLK